MLVIQYFLAIGCLQALEFDDLRWREGYNSMGDTVFEEIPEEKIAPKFNLNVIC